MIREPLCRAASTTRTPAKTGQNRRPACSSVGAARISLTADPLPDGPLLDHAAAERARLDLEGEADLAAPGRAPADSGACLAHAVE